MDYYPYEILEAKPMTHPAIAEAREELLKWISLPCGVREYHVDAIIAAAVERVCGELRHNIKGIGGYCLSGRVENTEHWMNGMAAWVNRVAEVLGEQDRWEFNGDGFNKVQKGTP
jgi:hypothetical protein